MNGDSSITSTISLGGSKLSDQTLVGTWESDCLVPDQNSPWAEQHEYIINSDGTAGHSRQSWPTTSCNGTPGSIITDHLKMTIPSTGKINMAYTGGDNAGNTNYDIYQVSGNNLEFGWGFRGDNLAYSGKTGTSEADRFDSLNSFIIYHKK